MSEYIDVEVRFLPAAAGGRSAPVSLAGSGTIRYMPHLRVGPSGEELGIAFVAGPSVTYPGETARGTAALLYAVDDSPLQPGAEFEVLEGRRCVGTGSSCAAGTRGQSGT